jgi:N-acetylglutamate synthase-like GNAT family acetyltransferase
MAISCFAMARQSAGATMDQHIESADGEIFRLRVADAQDAEAIVSVINVAFRKAEGFLLDRDRIDLPAVRELLQKGKFLVAEDKLLCGCVYLEQRGDRSYLGLLSVDPQLQKSGLGSQLMTAAEAYGVNAGSRFMDLQIVSVRKELPDFYHRRGYVETGNAPFPTGLNPKLPCHFILMSKPLT